MKEQILAVQRMQDYVEAHLEETVGLSDLAKVSLFSPWHSHRLFQEYTGLTPANYIRRLRLAKAALRIKNENVRIIDVAFDLGFGSVDGFTRAFFREFGMCPSEYAANPVPITLFVPYGAKFRALRKERTTMKTNNIFIQVIHKPARKVLCKRGIKAEDYFPYCEEVGCDVWGLLLSMDSLCGEPVSLWLPQQYKKPGTSTYVQGVEVDTDYHGAVPEGFDVIDLPEADYLMFQGEPFAEEDYCDAITAVQQAMDGYDPTVIGYVWDDSNPRIQLEPRGNRGYIELRSVCKK
ncbi:AraC family transcriptional regulator [Pseudoflavonifractor sp. MSJ-30]|nr:AraC family transcriptional regulator [Pseudoflavonifractor sp. MSJ-30]